MFDLFLAGALLAIVVLGRVAYWIKVPHPAGGWFERFKAGERTSLLGRSLVDATSWALAPIAKKLVEDRVPANAVTAASVVYGGASGMALAGGHFGIGAWLAASSALCDALDGMVARKSGTASPAGEALDSSVDRYSEFFFLTGLALHFRDSAWMLAVVLLALQGAFMVSFAETKAESLRVVVSPGWMRRPDRATLLIAGATLSALGAGLHAARWVVLAPVLAALLIDGLGANAAAARRLLRILAQLKGGSTARGAAAAGEAEEARGEPPPVSIIPAPAVVRPLPSARMLATERYHLSHR